MSVDFDMVSGVFVPTKRPSHRDAEYDACGFEMLLRMQREHFWYRGRHKVLLNVLKVEAPRRFGSSPQLRAIDLGGGCGGWVEYLHAEGQGLVRELALADSSLRALSLAEPVVGSFARRYQIDLLELPWSEEWDIAFLLDVIEHIPDDAEVLRQTLKILRPGGLLFVTTPALSLFWTYNDEFALHQRRYSRRDFHSLAQRTGLELLRADYFMFFLSPALVMSRLVCRPPRLTTAEERHAYTRRTHEIPRRRVNQLLSAIFSIEARLINSVRFPWGTSILGVFRRP
jgi:2-polyprenyl-3-methyl-5-hydroxy-6-metoxy-1,4-benzoquinol methylase